MPNLISMIIVFIFGFGTGMLIAYNRKTRHRIDLDTSLKAAKRIPSPAPIYEPPASEISPNLRAEILEKKILYEEELSLMFKMGREMFSGITIDTIAKNIIETANKVINAEICTLFLEDKDSEELIAIYAQGPKQELVRNIRLKKGDSLSGFVALKNEILIIEDVETNLWLKKQNSREFFRHNLISMPLTTKEKVIGVLNISGKKNAQHFAEHEIEFLKGIATEASIALQNATLYEQIQENYLKTITALAFALDAKDSYTRQHSENVTKYAVAIAKELNLDPSETEHIRRAGLLHDIGKIGIRDNVLLKPAKLSEDEYNDIKNHPYKGEVIVNALPFLKEEAKLIKHHHEHFDGTGYPDKISGQDIERGARILAVADSFDAMIENRVYRKAIGVTGAIEELKKNRGKQFDPEIVDAFLRILEKNPQAK
jgi:putative nucleotidyltransferase with HDIG domain